MSVSILYAYDEIDLAIICVALASLIVALVFKEKTWRKLTEPEFRAPDKKIRFFRRKAQEHERFEFRAKVGVLVPVRNTPLGQVKSVRIKRKKRILDGSPVKSDAACPAAKPPTRSSKPKTPLKKDWANLPLDIIGLVITKADRSTVENIRLVNLHWSHAVDVTIKVLKPMELIFGLASITEVAKKKFRNLVELRLEYGYRRETVDGKLLNSQLNCLCLSNLNTLRVRTPLFINSGMESVGKLTSLTVLDLSGCIRLSESGVRHLTNLVKLRDLHLEFCPLVGIKGLEIIAEMTQLRNLNLLGHNYATTREGMALLGELKGLECLTLGQGRASFSDPTPVSGLSALTVLSNLKALELSTVSVTTEAILQFTVLKGLTELRLPGVNFPGGWEDLKKELPVVDD